jgi:large subunit ribosomal protein L30
MNSKHNTVVVTQIASSIGRKRVQKLTLVGLGLRKIGATRTLSINPSIMGMINRVKHLLRVEKA